MNCIVKIITLTLIVLYIPLIALSPQEIAKMKLDFETAMKGGDYGAAKKIVGTLESSGAKTMALQLRVRLEEAVKNQQINAKDLEAEYRRKAGEERDLFEKQLKECEATSLKRITELTDKLKKAEDDLTREKKRFEDMQKKFDDAHKKVAALVRQAPAINHAYYIKPLDETAGKAYDKWQEDFENAFK